MTLEEAVEILKKSKYKYTERREELLTILATENKYVNAKNILTKIKDKYPDLSTDTVYRNLALFVDICVAERTELSGEKYFRFKCSGNEHHHHFICINCGSTKKITVCPMNEAKNQLENYEIIDHKFEIYGKCKRCFV